MKSHNNYLRYMCISWLILAIIGFDSADGATQVRSPAPFYAEYRVERFKSSELLAKDTEYADKMEKQVYREYLAKGYPENLARKYGKSLGDGLRKTCTEKRVSIKVFGSDGNSILFGYKLEDGRNALTVVKPDRVYNWDTWVPKGNEKLPAVTIVHSDNNNPLQKPLASEGVIFGFQALEDQIFIYGKPMFAKRTNEDIVYSYDDPRIGNASEMNTVVLDKQGRFVSSVLKTISKNGNATVSMWTASNYVKCNQGWIPKIITRKHYKGKLLTDWDYSHLGRLETDGPIFDRWFGDIVPEPAFVDDSRFGRKVFYFTRSKFLSDEEVKRRAEALASQDRPLSKPSPMKIAGVLLILIGAAVFIRRIGWPNKASSIDSNQEEKKQE